MGLSASSLTALGNTGFFADAGNRKDFLKGLMFLDQDNGKADGSIFKDAKLKNSYENLLNTENTGNDAQKTDAEKAFFEELTKNAKESDKNKVMIEPEKGNSIKTDMSVLKNLFNNFFKSMTLGGQDLTKVNDSGLKSSLDLMDNGSADHSFDNIYDELKQNFVNSHQQNPESPKNNDVASLSSDAKENFSNRLLNNVNNSGGASSSGTDESAGITNNGTPGEGMKSAIAGNYGGVTLTQEQVSNAKIIADVGKEMGLSQRDIQIAIMTAMQESSLKNINYGDRDSVGLFQQRPSCGWENDHDYSKFLSDKGLTGKWDSSEKSTNAHYAAWKFYDSLSKVGNRDQMSLTKAAQAVQRSAYPNAYAKHEEAAKALLA